MNQIKVQINSQIYALISDTHVSLISTETDQTLVHIPSHVMHRLNALQSILMQKTSDDIKE